jgi:hypothetical protein
MHTHKNRMTDLRLDEPDDYKICLRLDGPVFDGPLKTVTLQSLKQTLICEKQSLPVSVYSLRTLSGYCKYFRTLEIHNCLMYSVHSNDCAIDMYTV